MPPVLSWAMPQAEGSPGPFPAACTSAARAEPGLHTLGRAKGFLLTPFPLLTLYLPPIRPSADRGLTSASRLCNCAHSHGNNKHTIIDI